MEKPMVAVLAAYAAAEAPAGFSISSSFEQKTFSALLHYYEYVIY